jgi:ABC-type sugar transport system ATPase subunit
MSGVHLRKVIKSYGGTQVIHGVDLTIEDGEFCVFVGPSGCGKSTLLRMVAGLEEITEGAISIGARDVTRRWCQTNSNQSQFASKRANLYGTKKAPLSESGGAVQLEVLS